MPARLSFRTKKLFKRFSKVLLSLVLVFSVFGNFLPAFAQGTPQDTTYKEYYELFDPPNSTAKLGVTPESWLPLPTTGQPTTYKTVSDLTFVFSGQFNNESGLGLGKAPEWFWAHLRNFVGNDNVFVMRFCEADASGVPNEGSCIYAELPYDKQPSNTDVCGSEGCAANPIGTQQEYNTKLAQAMSKKIYHYEPPYSGVSVSPLDVSNLQELTKFPAINFSSLQFALLGQDDISNNIISRILYPNSTYEASMWYCASSSSFVGLKPPDTSDQALTNAVGSNSRIESFNRICGGRYAYFQIAKTIIKAPAANTPLDANGNPVLDTNVNAGDGTGFESIDPTASTLPTCAWFGLGSGSFVGCIAKGVHFLIYRPIAWFAGLMGSLFDFFLGYSLSDESYRAEFAVRGWEIVRDISNIFFIVILVWTGLASVLNIGNVSMKSVVPTLIVNALLINFSLFGTRAIIDVSNIVARVFYNNVEVCTGPCKDEDGDGKTDNLKIGAAGKYKPLSEKIVSSFNPQRIFQPSLFAKQMPDGNANNASLFGVQEQEDVATGWSRGDTNYAAVYIVVSLLASVILFAIASMFWKTAFLFLGRVIGLYIVMIFAPFAVLTRGRMPIVGALSQLKWDDWWKELSSYAMLAPIFVFFLYVIYMFLEADWLKAAQLGGESLFETVLAVGIPMLFIYVIVKQGVEIAKKYSGTVGGMVQNFVNGTIGGAGALLGGGIGLAAGASALVGRQVLGRGIKAVGAIKNKDGVSFAARMAARSDSSKLARNMNNFMKWSQTSSWDARNAGGKIMGRQVTLGGALTGGINALGRGVGEKSEDRISNNLGIGADAGKGGIKKMDEERVKAKQKKIESTINFDHLSDDEAKKAWEYHKNKIATDASRDKADHEYAMKKGGDYKTIQEELVAKLDELGGINSVIIEQQGKLRSATTPTDKAAAQNALNSANKDLKDKTAEVNKIKAKRKAELEKLKENDLDYQDTKEYKDALNAEKENQLKNFNKYGDIKNGKSFTAAMRAEYAEDLRKSSFWLKDGKVRTYGGTDDFGPGAALGSSALAAATIAGGGIGLALGAAAGTYIESMGDIMDQATKNIIDAAKKSQGKGSKLNKLASKLNNIENRLKEAVGLGEDGKLSDLDEAVIEEKLEEKKMEMEKKIQKDEQDMRREPDQTKREAMEKDIRIQKRRRAQMDKIIEDWEKAQENMDKYNDSQKKEEDKKKKGDDKDGKDGKKGDEDKDE